MTDPVRLAEGDYDEEDRFWVPGSRRLTKLGDYGVDLGEAERRVLADS